MPRPFDKFKERRQDVFGNACRAARITRPTPIAPEQCFDVPRGQQIKRFVDVFKKFDFDDALVPHKRIVEHIRRIDKRFASQSDAPDDSGKRGGQINERFVASLRGFVTRPKILKTATGGVGQVKKVDVSRPALKDELIHFLKSFLIDRNIADKSQMNPTNIEPQKIKSDKIPTK
jgi:hypothetical protein